MQEVAEAERVLAGEQRPVGPDQLLADERGQARRHLGLLGCERLHGAAVEDLALDRAPLEHAPLGRLELIQARREQRLQRGRDDHVAVRLAGHRQHLLDEERVAAGGARDLVAQLAGDLLRDQLVDVRVAAAARAEASPARWGGARRAPAAPCRAAGSTRPDGQERDVLDRSRNVSSPHWMSSKTTTSGRSAAACSSVLRNAQAISSADVAASVSPSSERIAAAAASSGGQQVELLQHLDDRPVGDPLAVGQAAAADDRRLDRARQLRGEPRLADAGIADDRDQLAALLGRTRSHASSQDRRARAHGRRTAPRAARSGASCTRSSR